MKVIVNPHHSLILLIQTARAEYQYPTTAALSENKMNPMKQFNPALILQKNSEASISNE